MKITKEELLNCAQAAVADRGLNYGAPEDNFVRIARLWNAHYYNRFGKPASFTADDVAMMMILVKLARLENIPAHLDSWIDLAGYAACGANIACEAE